MIPTSTRPVNAMNADQRANILEIGDTVQVTGFVEVDTGFSRRAFSPGMKLEVVDIDRKKDRVKISDPTVGEMMDRWVPIRVVRIIQKTSRYQGKR